MNKELEELKREEDRLLQSLMENRGKQRAINEAAFCEKNGIYIGDTVQFTDGKTGVILPFSYHRQSTSEPSYYEATLIKGDGSLGMFSRKIFPVQISGNQVKVIKRPNQ